jgi:hypothetical protein
MSRTIFVIICKVKAWVAKNAPRLLLNYCIDFCYMQNAMRMALAAGEAAATAAEAADAVQNQTI